MSTRRKAQRKQQQKNMPLGALLRSSQDNAVSRALLQLIEPYNDLEKDPEALERMLATGMMAWNLTVIPPEAAQDMLRALLDSLPAEEFKSVMLEMLDALIERKLELFPDDQRLISGYKIKLTGDGLDVQVSYYLPDVVADEG
jgi:hypothetical protein